MAIKLRVISDQYRDLGENRSRVFGVNGGTVGRAPDNDWVLPDPSRVVSGHHFEIEYRGGSYWLKDLSTNGVFVNEIEEPASVSGRVELRDGDRLRVGDYDILVSIDGRIDFLPASGEESSSIEHLGKDIGANIDLDSLLRPRDPAESTSSISARTAFGMRVQDDQRTVVDSFESRAHQHEPPPVPRSGQANGQSRTSAAPAREPPPPPASPPPSPPEAAAPPPAAAPAATDDWAMRTRPITRQELADALARRQSRLDARGRTEPFHQQASTWGDLRSAVQAFCRGAGIDPSSLSAEAQSMLPLVAGQLLREAVVGLNDIAQARASTAGALPATSAGGASGVSNPLRTSSSIEQAIQRLLESHGRLHGGPVDSLRDVLQEMKDHDAAMNAAMRAGLKAVLDQLSPTNVADQFEQGRSRTLAPGQDPRPRYWEHYAEFYRMLTQQNASGGVPHPFTEEFQREYARARAESRGKKQG